MLQGVEVEHLGRAQTALRRDAQRPPYDRLAAHADKDGAVILLQAVHTAQTVVVRFGRTDEAETRVEDELEVVHLRAAGGQVELAAQRPDVRYVPLTHHFVHRFTSPADVIDGHGSESVQRTAGYLRTEGVDGQGYIRQLVTDGRQRRLQPAPFALFIDGFAPRTGRTGTDIQYRSTIRKCPVRPLHQFLLRTQTRCRIKTVRRHVTNRHNLRFHAAKVVKNDEICKKIAQKLPKICIYAKKVVLLQAEMRKFAF